MRGLALALAGAGLTVELPLLPGHGTAIADMVPTRWEDWSAAADAAYLDLAARCESVVVVGLSMGGTLGVWLAERHPEIAALVLVNPLIQPPDADTVAFIDAMIDGGDEVACRASGPTSPSRVPSRRPTPNCPCGRPGRSSPRPARWRPGSARSPRRSSCSPAAEDHVVPPVSGDRLVEGVQGPVERIVLERSFHVATLDYDKDEIEARTVKFVTDLLPPAGA